MEFNAIAVPVWEVLKKKAELSYRQLSALFQPGISL
jgi:hypothetical protein